MIGNIYMNPSNGNLVTVTGLGNAKYGVRAKAHDTGLEGVYGVGDFEARVADGSLVLVGVGVSAGDELADATGVVIIVVLRVNEDGSVVAAHAHIDHEVTYRPGSLQSQIKWGTLVKTLKGTLCWSSHSEGHTFMVRDEGIRVADRFVVYVDGVEVSRHAVISEAVDRAPLPAPDVECR